MTTITRPHVRRKLALWAPLTIIGVIIYVASFPAHTEHVVIGWVIATVGVLGLMGDQTS